MASRYYTYTDNQPRSNPPHIQGISGAFCNTRITLGAPCLRLGTNPHHCNLLFPRYANGISGEHCRIWMQGRRMILQDLGSTYGTYIASGRLSAMETVELRRGDRFWLGSEKEAFLVE